MSAKILGEPKNGTSLLKYLRSIGFLTRKYWKNTKKCIFWPFRPILLLFFSQIHPFTPPWNNFSNFLVKNCLNTFPKFWHMTSFLPQKWLNLGHFHLKWPIFDQIDPINDYFDQIYVHKPDWNNWYKRLGKKLFDHLL